MVQSEQRKIRLVPLPTVTNATIDEDLYVGNSVKPKCLITKDHWVAVNIVNTFLSLGCTNILITYLFRNMKSYNKKNKT